MGSLGSCTSAVLHSAWRAIADEWNSLYQSIRETPVSLALPPTLRWQRAWAELKTVVISWALLNSTPSSRRFPNPVPEPQLQRANHFHPEDSWFCLSERLSDKCFPNGSRFTRTSIKLFDPNRQEDQPVFDACRDCMSSCNLNDKRRYVTDINANNENKKVTAATTPEHRPPPSTGHVPSSRLGGSFTSLHRPMTAGRVRRWPPRHSGP